MFETKFDSSKMNYLLDCDTILKYQLKSGYNIPKVDSLTLQVSLKNVLLASDFINKEAYNKNIQIKSILLLYMICSTMPYISFYNYKNSRFLRDKNAGDFILKLNVSNKNTIQQIFKELNFDNIDFLSIKEEAKIDKVFSYNLKIPATSFQSINNYFRKTNSLLNLNRIDVQVSVIYKNALKVKSGNLLNVLKNSSSFG